MACSLSPGYERCVPCAPLGTPKSKPAIRLMSLRRLPALSPHQVQSKFPVSPNTLRRGVWGKAVKTIPESARRKHDKNVRIQAPIDHQDTRNLSCRARFSSPRGATNKASRELARTRRIRHGIARAIENLRGLRLSLVPGSNPRGCLLFPV